MKNTIFLLISLFLVSCDCNDDGDCPPGAGPELLILENDEFILKNVDSGPVYINGGERGFLEALYREIRYPSQAKENGTEGTVILQYEINPAGEMANVILLENVEDGIGEECLRVFDVLFQGQDFHPASLCNEQLHIRTTVPIKFKLE